MYHDIKPWPYIPHHYNKIPHELHKKTKGKAGKSMDIAIKCTA